MKHFRLTVTSMTSHYLYITTPDNVEINDVCEHWRDFDGGDFSTDDEGDWEYSDLEEVKEEEVDSFCVEWDKEDIDND